MEANISTTCSQSERLLKCGVPAATADMRRTKNSPEAISCKCIDSEWLLASETNNKELDLFGLSLFYSWSFSALLGLLPKKINNFWMTKWYAPNVDGFEIDDMEIPYQLSGDFQLLHIGGGNYQVEYDWDGFRGKLPQSDNPIEACVLAIELLTANGYKLNEI